eukprot:RCo018573
MNLVSQPEDRVEGKLHQHGASFIAARVRLQNDIKALVAHCQQNSLWARVWQQSRVQAVVEQCNRSQLLRNHSTRERAPTRLSGLLPKVVIRPVPLINLCSSVVQEQWNARVPHWISTGVKQAVACRSRGEEEVIGALEHHHKAELIPRSRADREAGGLVHHRRPRACRSGVGHPHTAQHFVPRAKGLLQRGQQLSRVAIFGQRHELPRGVAAKLEQWVGTAEHGPSQPRDWGGIRDDLNGNLKTPHRGRHPGQGHRGCLGGHTAGGDREAGVGAGPPAVNPLLIAVLDPIRTSRRPRGDGAAHANP